MIKLGNQEITLKVGSADIKLQDYLQIKVMAISQSDYDLLPTKDSSTLYVITNVVN